MKKLLIAVILLFIGIFSFAQGDSYQDLLISKADGNWDKLIKRAESYTLKNSTSKDPTPYYYLAFGLYKISMDADRDDKYKNAYKDAFNAIGKMIRYDKNGEVVSEFSEFVEELKKSLFELILNDLDANQPRRAFGWAMRLYKFGRDYVPVYYLEGALRYENKDRSTARLKWQSGDEMLKDANIASWSNADKELFMLGLYISALYLKEDRQMDAAKEMLRIGDTYFDDEETWHDYVDEIMN